MIREDPNFGTLADVKYCITAEIPTLEEVEMLFDRYWSTVDILFRFLDRESLTPGFNKHKDLLLQNPHPEGKEDVNGTRKLLALLFTILAMSSLDVCTIRRTKMYFYRGMLQTSGLTDPRYPLESILISFSRVTSQMETGLNIWKAVYCYHIHSKSMVPE